MKLEVKSYLIDTHAHLDDKQFDADREEVIQRAFQNGVEKIVNIGAGIGSSERSVELAQKHENIFSSVGLHPEYFMKHAGFPEEYGEKLENLIQNKKVVAIGEIGLDYHNHGEEITGEDKKKQIAGFIFQLELARKCKKPVIIHCRGERDLSAARFQEKIDAYEDVFEIIEKFSNLQFVFHSFAGNLQFIEKLLSKNNILFSFTGNLTYNKPGSEILAVVEKIPLERIMLETDCPYLSPVPMRGKRNEPAYVKFVAKKIAEIKKMEMSEVELTTSANAERFFGLE